MNLSINIKGLRIFCEVARQKSFSRAATILSITQSAASQAVQHLEKELKLQLFDRSHQPPQLTPAGDRFYVTCRDLLDRFDRTITQIKEMDNEVVGPVAVASIYSLGLYQADIIRKFMELYPKANVRLQFLRPNLVLQSVQQGETMLGLISYPRETREIAVVPWRNEKMVLVGPADHRLARGEKLPYTALQGEQFVAFDADLAIRKRVDATLLKHKIEVDIAVEFDNVETMKQAVQIGLGLSILPMATVEQELRHGTLAEIPLQKPLNIVRPVGIIFRKGKPLSVAARQFIELLTRDQLPELATPLDLDSANEAHLEAEELLTSDHLSAAPAFLSANR